MDLKHLHTFLILSQLRSFTKTAEYLHYAQSNVTNHIQLLEKELNTKLFERLGKTVSLTSEGTELIPYAQEMLNISKDMRLKFSEKAGGRIVIGASESICIYRLPDIIKKFRVDYPDVELYLEVLDTKDFVPMLSSHEIDIAFVLDSPVSSPNINVAFTRDEAIGLFSTPDYYLASFQKVSVGDLSHVPMILTGKECCYRKLFERELLYHHVIPKVVLETGSLQVIKQTALSGLGVCLLPRMAVEKEVECGELVELAYVTEGIVSQLIYHRDKWMSKELEGFVKMVPEMSKPIHEVGCGQRPR